MKLEDLLVQLKPEIKLPDYIMNDSELVGYPDEEMQHEIYSWAIQGLNLHSKTILDVGAGRGDLYKLLPGTVNYVGIELKESLCLTGTEKYNSNNFSILNQNYLSTEFHEDALPDYIFVIGTLNSIQTNDKWAEFNNFFTKTYTECKYATIFILSSKSDDAQLNEFPFDKLFTNVLLDGNIPFQIDYSKFPDIYKLTIFK